jgi:hypothetical protein
VNQAMLSIKTKLEYENYFKLALKPLPNDCDTYFVMLNPNFEDLSTKTLEEKAEWLVKTRDVYEVEKLQNYTESITGSRMINPLISKKYGVNSVSKALTEKINLEYIKQLPTIKKTVETLYKDQLTQFKNIQRKIDQNQQRNLIPMFMNYTNDLKSKILEVQFRGIIHKIFIFNIINKLFIIFSIQFNIL